MLSSTLISHKQVRITAFNYFKNNSEQFEDFFTGKTINAYITKHSTVISNIISNALKIIGLMKIY